MEKEKLIFFNEVNSETQNFEYYYGRDDDECFIIEGQVDKFAEQEWEVNQLEDHYINIKDTNNIEITLSHFKTLVNWNEIVKTIEVVANNEL